jgi:predicted MPP superfamily phosphohydrolase
LTGNELPWFDAVNQLPMPSEQPASDLAILLSHSPDQIDWATSYKFDLMFAGHTHGGQIAFPVIGPIVAPSKYGVKYASGTFQVGDTLMHVSRGISGDEPIRVNSPPELGQFVIERIS